MLLLPMESIIGPDHLSERPVLPEPIVVKRKERFFANSLLKRCQRIRFY